MVWLYTIFAPMTAYGIGQTIMRFAAFFGMYLLLKNFTSFGLKLPFISVGTALTFALLPYWPSGMLSIAGLPLALFLTIVTLNLTNHCIKGINLARNFGQHHAITAGLDYANGAWLHT